MSKPVYTSGSIQNKSQMELMRFRPAFAIGSKDVGGQVHAIGEIITNSKDEMPYVENGSIQMTVFVDREKQLYQIAVSDNGRGVPLPSLVDVFTKPHTSGKYNQDAYISSAGLFGIGAKATLATTSRFRAISARDAVYGNKEDNDVGYSSVTTNQLEIVEHTANTTEPALEHGTLVVFEFDKNVMINMNDFIEEGYQRVIDIMQKWHLFMSNIHFSMKFVEKLIPEKFWTTDITDALLTYKKNVDKGVYVYDSKDWEDPIKYLSEYWNISSNMAWESGEIRKYRIADDRLSFQLMMYLPKRISGFGIIGFVNDVPINRADSSHVIGWTNATKKFIASYIEDTAVKNFFLDRYKLPLYITMDIRYAGAEFIGATKESFRDAEFQKKFEADLAEFYKVASPVMEQLVAALMDHIVIEYNKAFNKPIEVTSEQKLMLKLNNPKSYSDCNTYGPNSELFIVEGTSASGAAKHRDSEYQAMIATRGKPFNGVGSMTSSRKEAIQRIMKDRIWQDIVRVMGLQPGNDDQDLRTLRFGKICIMHDADPDGSHIEAIYVAGFYILNPRLITEGYIWISKPPLFLLQKKQSNSAKSKFFMFNESAIMDYYVLLYNELYSIALKNKTSNTVTALDDNAFRSFCYVVLDIGEKIRDIAERLDIPDFIFECLLHCLPYLDAERLNGVDVQMIRRILPFEHVSYDITANALIVSNGMSDYTITLRGFLTEVYTNIYKDLKSIEWDTFDILVTTKRTDLMKDETVSFIKLFKMFKLVDDMFDTERFKGLGTMKPEDLAATCMAPKTRALFHIESLDDAQVLFDMMGTDATARRELLRKQNLVL